MNFLGDAGRGTSAARTKTSLDSSGSSAGWAKLGVWHRLGTYHRTLGSSADVQSTWSASGVGTIAGVLHTWMHSTS